MPRLTEAGQREALETLCASIRQWDRWSSYEYLFNNSSLEKIEKKVSNNKHLSQDEYDYLADIISKELTYKIIVEYTVNYERDEIYLQDMQGLSEDKIINIAWETLEQITDYSVSRTHEVHLTPASCPLPPASKR
ncbi:MAG: hypothetical protein QNJ42_08815 [Crocosphaera sp.]|nr:hypothetical protein [Crocosphaera sp.]